MLCSSFCLKNTNTKAATYFAFFVVLLKFFCSPFESCGRWLWKKKSSSTWLRFLTWASAIQCTMLFYFLIRRKRRTVLICDINGHLNIGTSMIHTKIMHNRKVYVNPLYNIACIPNSTSCIQTFSIILPENLHCLLFLHVSKTWIVVLLSYVQYLSVSICRYLDVHCDFK